MYHKVKSNRFDYNKDFLQNLTDGFYLYFSNTIYLIASSWVHCCPSSEAKLLPPLR